MITNKFIIKAYKEACRNVVDAFVETYFKNDGVDLHDIGGEVDGCWGVNDYFFTLQDMGVALENKIPWKVLENWYYDCLDEKKEHMNLKSFFGIHYKFANKVKFKNKK